MKDYEIINDWHLSGPFAYEKVMEEVAKAFRNLSRSHLDDIEAEVGRTFGVIATLFRTVPIPEDPSTWASQIAASLKEEGLEFQKLTRRWFLFYLQCKGGRNYPAPLPRALEVIFKLCPTDPHLYTQTRAVYQAGLAMAVLSKNDVHFRYYALRALRLEQSIKQNTAEPSYKDKRLFAVAHMNFAIAEATAGEWHSALDYLRQAEQLHIARKGPLPAARLRPELMSTRQDLFEVYCHMALVTCRLSEHIQPDDSCHNAYLLYDDAAGFLELAKKQLKPTPYNNEARSCQLDWAKAQMVLSRSMTMAKGHPVPYAYVAYEDRRESHMRAEIHQGLCRRFFGPRHRWTVLSEYRFVWTSILYAQHRMPHDSKLDIEYLIERLATSPLRKPDHARATFLYSRCLRAVGEAEDADFWLTRSVSAYNSLRPNDQRDATNLTWKEINSLFRYEYLDSLHVEFGDYIEDGYLDSWFEANEESEEESEEYEAEEDVEDVEDEEDVEDVEDVEEIESQGGELMVLALSSWGGESSTDRPWRQIHRAGDSA